MQNKILLSSDSLGLRQGSTAPEVSELQTYLSRFGWLRLPGQQPVVAAHDRLREVQPGNFDAATEAALADFQRFYRLPVSGDLNAETLALLRRPRCGVPDEPLTHAAGPGDFVAGATKWNKLHVGYQLNQGTPDLSDADVNGALHTAYRRWCLVAQIVLQQVPANPDIDVRLSSAASTSGGSEMFSM